MKFGAKRRGRAAQAAADVEHHHHVAPAPAVGEPAGRQREDAEGEEGRGAERQQFAIGPAVDHLEPDHHGREDQHHVMVDGMGEVDEADGQPAAVVVIERLRGKGHRAVRESRSQCAAYTASRACAPMPIAKTCQPVGPRWLLITGETWIFRLCRTSGTGWTVYNHRAHSLTRWPARIRAAGAGASMCKGGRVATAFLLAVAFCAAPQGAWAETDAADDLDHSILAALAQAPAQSSAVRAHGPSRRRRSRRGFSCSQAPISGGRAALLMAACCGRRPASTAKARCSS